MPELVRFDAYELFVRKDTLRRWGGVAVIVFVTVWGLAALIKGGLPVFLVHLIAILPLLAIGISEVRPTYLRICFADRSYQLVSNWDWLMLRREGRTGGFDDFDRVRLKSEVGEAGTVWWIDLSWKDPRREHCTLLLGASEADTRALAERLATYLGVQLETDTQFLASDG